MINLSTAEWCAIYNAPMKNASLGQPDIPGVPWHFPQMHGCSFENYCQR